VSQGTLHVTGDLPGTGGVLRARPADFFVEEIPAYTPAGKGDHVLATVEKTGLTTNDAVKLIADALKIRVGDIGVAGLKDRHAVTRQLISLPPPVTPEQALALHLKDISILDAARHGNKLKTGHLRGNRFVLTLRDLAVAPDEALARAQLILARLSRPPGLPNWYGEQRFGDGRNAERGKAVVLGDRGQGSPRDRRFLVSSYQSLLFNRYLEERLKDGLYDRVITGDILKKGTGGMFATESPETDQPRLAAGEIIPTGPMFGVSMRAPVPGTDAAAREDRILAAEGLTAPDFARVKAIAEGTRRPLAVPVDEASVELEGDALVLRFVLPAGAYATVLVAEITKGP
jgi:tRNA pseudouridine13 synthase